MNILNDLLTPTIMGSGMVFGIRVIAKFIIIPRQLLFLGFGAILATFGVITKEHEVMQFTSTVAIMLVLFQTGLGEESVRAFFISVIKNIRVAIVSAIGPWVGAFVAVNYFLELSMQEAVIAGAVFTATALPFTLGLLRSKGLIKTPAAKSAIAASTTDDILASLLGTFTAIFLATSSGSDGMNIWDAGIKMAQVLAFFVLIYVLSIIIDPHSSTKKAWIDLFRFTRHFYDRGITTPFIILMMSALVYLGEAFFHVHYAIGALLVGLLFKGDQFYSGENDPQVAVPDKNAPTFDNFEVSLSLFTRNIEPFFYIFLGLHLDFSAISLIALKDGFVIFVCVATLQFASAYLSGRWIGLGKSDGILLGMAMLPRDVLAFVVLSMNASHIPASSALFPSCIIAIALLDILTAMGIQLYSTEPIVEKEEEAPSDIADPIVEGGK